MRFLGCWIDILVDWLLILVLAISGCCFVSCYSCFFGVFVGVVIVLWLFNSCVTRCRVVTIGWFLFAVFLFDWWFVCCLGYLFCFGFTGINGV